MDIGISGYGKYSSDNYGVNSIRLDVGSLTLWFSYKTVIAFQPGWNETFVSENIWGNTTGKHLNWINPDHSIRLDRDEFEAKLEEVLKEHSLDV